MGRRFIQHQTEFMIIMFHFIFSCVNTNWNFNFAKKNYSIQFKSERTGEEVEKEYDLIRGFIME